jgi:hypothetical protein
VAAGWPESRGAAARRRLEERVLGRRPSGGSSPAQHAHRVLVRLTTGERIELGTFPDRAAAEAGARSFIASLEDDPWEWPAVGRRFVPPDAIVSVDIAHRQVR